MSRDDLYSWLALGRIFGIGSISYRRLIERFGSPEKVFQASPAELSTVEGLRKDAAQAIIRHKRDPLVDREMDLLERHGIGVLTLADPLFPPLLAGIHDPPPFLYYKGSPSPLDRQSIAVVGSRHGTPYGIRTTERLACSLSRQPLTVVSGLARGIDAAAHRGALLAGGRTVAVLGSGLDVVYPPENSALYEQIVEGGMVCSEYPLGTLPERQNFPVRNRIISGLSLGVVVVEATQHSGSLITARLALEQGREVFAVPGSVESLRSSGAHRLIRQGAKLVEQVEDILEELTWSRPESPGLQKAPEETPPALSLSSEQKRIWECLSSDPIHVDEISRQSGLEIAVLLSFLLEMELEGLVKQFPGKFFIRP